MRQIIVFLMMVGLLLAKPPKQPGQRPWMLVHATELDVNGDGVVEYKAELLVEIARVFAGFDADDDGGISHAESQGKGPRSPLGGFVKGHARELDKDGDGGISKAELSALFTRFFDRVDRDANGRLDPAEYASEPDKENASRPNVVVILVVDMGWQDTGFAGSKYIKTPQLDRYTATGTVFSTAYASAPNCAPTRACLMSGQYPPRHGIYTVVDERHAPGSPHHKVVAATSKAAMDTEVVTITEALKAQGYATAMFGMWNLGRGRSGPSTPLGQGFEVFKSPRELGFEKNAYFDADGRYLTDAFTDEGIGFAGAQTRPFFLYLAYHAVHAPFHPKPELLKKYADSPNPEYAASVEALDDNIGRLMQSLDLSRTLVIFTSDNGGNRKATSDAPVLSIDIYPSVLEMAGLPAQPGLDGVSFANSASREAVYWHFPSYIGGGGPSSAMRMGTHKLIEHFESGKVELFDLATDPSELRDLAESNRQLRNQLYAKLRAWQDETRAPRPPAVNPNYDPKAQPKRGRDQRGKGKKGGKQ